MPGILAIETSSDACSVATLHHDTLREKHVVEPRKHNQLIFSLLRELIEPGELNVENYAAIAYGVGPGSFTGLRIAASAVQGLTYASGIPAIGISTLAAVAQRALRERIVATGDFVCAVTDAKIGEVYAALFRFDNGVATLEAGPWATKPENLDVPASCSVHIVGDGAGDFDAFPGSLRDRTVSVSPHVLPTARDVAHLASQALERGEIQAAYDVQPVYVRDEISWKKLSEQGKPT